MIGQRIPGHTDQLNCFIDLKIVKKQEWIPAQVLPLRHYHYQCVIIASVPQETKRTRQNTKRNEKIVFVSVLFSLSINYELEIICNSLNYLYFIIFLKTSRILINSKNIHQSGILSVPVFIMSVNSLFSPLLTPFLLNQVRERGQWPITFGSPPH